MRRLSKGMVGNAYRAEIAWAIGRGETEILTAHGVATDLGIPHNLVSSQLKAFVSIGIMENVPSVEGQRFRYYRRLESPYWGAMCDLFDCLMADPDHNRQDRGSSRQLPES